MDTAILERRVMATRRGGEELGRDDGSEDGGAGRMTGRRSAEKLMALAGHLPGEERLLLEQVYVHGVTISGLARLRGARRFATARRLARVIRRVRSPLFGFLAGHGDLFPRPTRRIAERVVFGGLSLRDTAQETGYSLHEVREAVRMVRVWARE